MPIWVGTCPAHGPFERLLPSLTGGHPPTVLKCPAEKCRKSVPRDATAPAIRFKGDGFQTPRPAPRASEVGTAKLKQERY